VESANDIASQEDWVDQTNNPPPKNATWMFPNFNPKPALPPPNMKGSSSVPSQTRSHRASDAASNPMPAHLTPGTILRNAQDQRIDIPEQLNINLDLVNELRNRQPRLCNSHYLVRGCTNESCPFDHSSTLSDDEFEALLYLSRSQRCPQGSSCTHAHCIKGHMCPNGSNCRHGNRCRFASFHGIDTDICT